MKSSISAPAFILLLVCKVLHSHIKPALFQPKLGDIKMRITSVTLRNESILSISGKQFIVSVLQLYNHFTYYTVLLYPQYSITLFPIKCYCIPNKVVLYWE